MKLNLPTIFSGNAKYCNYCPFGGTFYALLYAFNASILLYIFLVVAQILAIFYLFKQKGVKEKILHSSILFFIIATAFLNGFAYPNLLKYQSSSQVAFYISKHKIPKDNLFQKIFISELSTIIAEVMFLILPIKIIRKTFYIFTDEAGKKEIEQKYIIKEVKSFDDFNVTRLSFYYF
ncbi:MAG: hypothetical protein R2777_00460 [Chitinophagales bacterium]